MGDYLLIILLFSSFVQLSFSFPLCSNSRAPISLNATLRFCPYSGSTCCNSMGEMRLQKQYRAMNISDPGCASLLQSILCAKCDPFSGELFRIDTTRRAVPVLCNSTVTEDSSQSSQAAYDFCSKVWNACQNVSIFAPLFAPSLRGKGEVSINSNNTKVSDFWQSKTDFCNAFGGASTAGGVCFSGEPVALNKTYNYSPIDGLCLEKIGYGSYINMVAHPDGSDRAFFSSQPGKIWLASIPWKDSGRTLEIDESRPFIDLTDRVHFDAQFGMMGMAFHPNFAQNGRFFVSFNCDEVTSPECKGRCSCNSDVGCDPSKLPFSDNNGKPCQYQAAVAEYSANGTASGLSEATTARPVEVRRILTLGLPFNSHHGGQILFGPSDGYLYFMMGDGGSQGDPLNLSQNKKSIIGKILRLNVDDTPSIEEIDELGLWGNYTIPNDNPFKEDKELQPEVWALGLRNPRRCCFDSERPSYFLCGDVGEDLYEEVNVITKGGNYGWHMYEGPYQYTGLQSSGVNLSAEYATLIFPVMGFKHSEVNKKVRSASVTGGYFYRSMTDPCLHGRYVYGDLYAGAIWAGAEIPEGSGNFTTAKVNFTCAHDSPIRCSFVPRSSIPSLGYIFSFAEDNRKDLLLLASTGVYRVVRPSRCNFACSKENLTAIRSPGPHASYFSSASRLSDPYNILLFTLYLLAFSLHLGYYICPFLV